VHTVSREFLIDTALVELERKVDPNDFIRIHRSTLVNLSWIAEIRRAYDGKQTVVLKDAKNTELAVSRMYADNLKTL
jgi:two-component system LytT family response regulator